MLAKRNVHTPNVQIVPDREARVNILLLYQLYFIASAVLVYKFGHTSPKMDSAERNDNLGPSTDASSDGDVILVVGP